MRGFARALFGAHAQVVLGVAFTLVALYLWLHYTIFAEPSVRTVFHVSMLFGVAATYSIVAAGLGYRATERVEAHVDPTVSVEHADEVNVGP